MGNVVTKTSQGALRGGTLDGAVTGRDLLVVLLKEAEADGTLREYGDLGTLLAASGNTEADFTNYARKVVAQAGVSETYDDTAKAWNFDMPDVVWEEAGGVADNTLAKLLVCSDLLSEGDASIHVHTIYDFVETTDGRDLRAKIHEDGFAVVRDPAA